MPFVSITVVSPKTAEYVSALSSLVHQAMIETVNCPPAALYHSIHQVERGSLFYNDEYKGMRRSDDLVTLQMTLKQGRTPEMKKAMYERITVDANRLLGIRPEDLVIIVRENTAEDWYFGRQG